MPLRDDILAPIPGDSPSGENLRYDPLYDRIKEARREDDDLPTGELPEGPRKTADHALVVRLAGEAIATRTKDLQLAAWLTEALVHREGFGGLSQGLDVLRGLLTEFWDSLYPEMEDEEEDLELRAAPLEWVGGRLVIAVRTVPLTRGGHGHLSYEESRDVGYEHSVQDNEEKRRRRLEKLDEGKISAEAWDQAVEGTDIAFYQQLDTELTAAQDSLRSLGDVSDERFGREAPSYTPLREALDQVRMTVGSILRKRLPPEPEVAVGEGDATDEVASAATPGGSGAAAPGVAGGMSRRPAGGPTLLEIASAEVRAGRPARAVEMLMAAANRGRSRRDRFLRRTAVARIMVDASLFPVAVPLLEQLLTEIDEFKLEEWEPGPVVATPMSLLWRCYDRTDNHHLKEALYLRICRLDPVQAIPLTPQGD